jgi:phage protein D/phage baseplate assembly protein gpV
MPDGMVTAVTTIKVNGQAIANTIYSELVDARVRLSMLQTSSAVLRFSDQTFELIDGSIFGIGDTIDIGFSTDDAAVTTSVFKGEVVALGAEQRADQRHEFVVEAMDRSYKLSAEASPKTYLKMSWSDIVGKIAGNHGLSAQADSTGVKHDYVLQTVNDRLFLDRIADSIGFEWYVDDTKLVFRKRKKSSADVTLNWTTNLRRFEVRASANDVVKGVTVNGWDRKQGAEINGQAAGAFDAGLVGANSPLAQSTYTTGSGKAKPVKLVPAAALDSAEAKQYAEAVNAMTQASVLRVSGETDGEPKIKAGGWVKVEGVGTKLKGDYYVTEAEHVFGGGQTYITRFRLSNDRVSMPTPATAAGATAGGFGHTGFVVGIVTNIDDAENRQRVKVKFPTLPGLESEWARVLLLGGGPKTGVDMRPEVNDEVLVGFEHGDLRLPYVIGGLTHQASDEVAPAVKDKKVAIRSITSREGHRIELLDGSDKEKMHVQITTADGKTKARFGQDMIELNTTAADGLVFTDGKAKIIMKDGKVTIDADSLEIMTKQGVKVEAKTKIEMKATAGMNLDGGPQVEIKASGTAKLDGGGMTEIKGGMVKLN